MSELIYFTPSSHAERHWDISIVLPCKRHLSQFTISPALENAGSDEALEAGDAKKSLAILAKVGRNWL